MRVKREELIEAMYKIRHLTQSLEYLFSISRELEEVKRKVMRLAMFKKQDAREKLEEAFNVISEFLRKLRQEREQELEEVFTKFI